MPMTKYMIMFSLFVVEAIWGRILQPRFCVAGHLLGSNVNSRDIPCYAWSATRNVWFFSMDLVNFSKSAWVS